MDHRFGLMRHRLRRVLLLGSRYDEYILREAGFTVPGEEPPEVLGVQASCVLATGAEEALDVVANTEVDLVLSDLRLCSGDAFEVMGRLKRARPDLLSVLLTSNPAYHGPLVQVPRVRPFDFVFAWRGRTELLQAVVLMLEDRLNADHDLLVGGVQLVLLVEDEPGLYSHYLPLLYELICERARDLSPADAPAAERSRRLAARTKLILATTYEEALVLMGRYGSALCGVISDLQFPRDGQLDPEAGLHLARHVRLLRESIPVVIQSRDQTVEPRAHEAGAFFVSKQSDHLLRELRDIMMDYFGFGDFIFRFPDGTEAGRAHDLRQLADQLRVVPSEVFRYHGSRSHFSTWLFIHGEHELARALRAMRSTDEATRTSALCLIERTLERASNLRK